MAEKFYKISEKDLIHLLYYCCKFDALECGGVDNWEYYSESIHEYVEEYKEENNIPKEEEFDLENIVYKEIENYEEIK